MKYYYIRCVACVILFYSQNANGVESKYSSEMITECVGRMQLSIPKDFDVAVNPTKTFIQEFSHPSRGSRFEFLDAQHAGYSDQYYSGRILIFNLLDAADKKYILDSAKAEIIDTRARVKK